MAFAALSALALTSAAGSATEPTAAELADARDRFAKARKLEDAGQWSEALDLLQKVAEVKLTPQVRFHVALCMEKVGLLTQALEGFQLASREAAHDAPQVVKESKDHIRDLEKRIPTVTVTVAGASGSDQLLLDGRPIPIGDPPLPVRVDPGPHKAEVRRGQALVARQLFVLEASVTRRVELRVGAVEADPNAPPEPPPTPTVTPTAAPPPTATPTTVPPPPDRSSGNTQRVLGWTAVGVGVVSAAAMGLFIGLRASKLNELQQACPTLAHCPSSAEPIISDGKTDAALVNVFGAAAAVALVGGIVLVVTAPPARRARTSTGARPPWSASVRATGSGLRVEGAF